MDAIHFLYPNVLWAWLLLIVPILIHLFNFRKYKTVYFTNVALLKSIKQETKSKSQLKQILILCMRLFFIFFLVLAFSQPYILKDDAKALANDKLVLVLDNSFSMSAEGESGMQMEYAKRKALEVLNSYPQSVKMMLVSSDVENRQLFFKSKEELIAELAKIKVSPFARKLNEVLKIVSNRLKINKYKADIYLISDYQKSDFDLENKEDLSFKMIHLPSFPSDNVSIDTAYFLSPIHTRFSNEALVYTLRNSGNKDWVDFPVELKLNDTIKSIANVTLPAHSRVNDTIRFSNPKSGFQRALLSIQDLPVTFDNYLYFSYKNIDKIQTSLITNEADNAYLKALFKDNPFFETHFFSSDKVDYSILERSDLVVFVEDKCHSENLISLISQQLNRGSKIIHFACDNSRLLSTLGISQIKTDSSVCHLSGFNAQSDLFKDALKKQNDRYDLPKVKSGYAFSKDLSAILFDRKEQSFVTLKDFDKGRLLSFSVSLNQDNYDFYSHPIIIPMIYNFSAKQEEQALFYETDKGGLFFLNKINPSSDAVVEIESKTTRIIPEQYGGNNTLKLILPERLEAGYYSIKSDDRVLGAFSVNNSRKESYQSFYAQTDLEQAGYDVFEARSIRSDNMSEITQSTISLWYLLLGLSLLFLFLEIFFLWLFKNR